jgi:2'-5' RNA ligase
MKKFGISEFQQKKPTFHDNSTCKEILQVRVDSASSAEAREFTSNKIIYLIHAGKLYFISQTRQVERIFYMYRLFIAIDFPDITKEHIADICFGVPGANWTPMDQLHLTMRFIGEVDDNCYARISYALSEVTAQNFDLTFAGVGTFRDKVIWVGIEKNEGLMLLKKEIEKSLAKIGIDPEQRQFSPHITLARLARSTSDRKIADFLSVNGLFRLEPIKVACFYLYSSVLTPRGAFHRKENSYKLL